MKNNISREQAINWVVKELNLLPFQEQIVREMWETRSYLVPVRHSGWSHTRALLTVADILLRKDKQCYHKND